jgi:hypothetical protein
MIEQGEGLLLPAIDVEGEGRASSGTLPLSNTALRPEPEDGLTTVWGVNRCSYPKPT